MFRGLTFGHATAFFLFLLLPIFLVLFLMHFFWKRETAQALGDVFYPIQESKKGGFFLLGWVFLVLAMTFPEGYPVPERVESISTKIRTQELLFLLDTSASMGVRDENLGKTRLEEAKLRIHEIMKPFPESEVSLYSLSKGLLPLVPPTTDRLFFSLILDPIGVNEGGLYGSDFTQGIKELAKKIANKGQDAATIVFLLSDGEDLSVTSLPKEEQEKEIERIASELPSPKAFPYAFYVVPVGTEEGGRVPGVVWKGEKVISHQEQDLLQALANKGDGTVYPPADVSFSSWIETIQAEEQALEKPLQQEEIILQQGTPFYQIPLLCSLFFFLWAML